ncbi:hypothetical protein [Leptolyngbya sp. FACHB-261]|uniref:hypothetical protein n=1 Tax=Leptolyngbya sp. FACHB-261 TaxID=2692806 RepID=UPI0018EF4C60|nr:hypothetical protein [Leptolyngbya sp. FACHB-261]
MRTKQAVLSRQPNQDRWGLWQVHWQLGEITVFSSFYTPTDLACLLWGIITVAIFVTAQFLPLSWNIQAILWTALTLAGTIAMVNLTQAWVKVKRLSWVLHAWVALMLFGLILTDLSIFLCWGQVLTRLCPLWLGLSALGYFLTSLELRSRVFLLAGFIHLVGILALPYLSSLQYLSTGIFMAISLLLLAEFVWDIRLPIELQQLAVPTAEPLLK